MVHEITYFDVIYFWKPPQLIVWLGLFSLEKTTPFVTPEEIISRQGRQGFVTLHVIIQRDSASLEGHKDWQNVPSHTFDLLEGSIQIKD